MAENIDEKYGYFPAPFATIEEKKKPFYGLQYAKAIFDEYAKNSPIFSTTIANFKICRKYAAGLEDIDKYKDRLQLNGDTSWLNLDFSPVNRIAHLVDIILGKLLDKTYKIQCNPIDVFAKTQEDEARNKMYAEMFLKKHAADIENTTGIPVYPRGKEIPDTDQDAELFFKLNFKQASSIAMEELLMFVFMNNDFDSYTKQKILRDLIVINRAAIQRYYDGDRNIKVRYIDYVDLITPYSKYDDFRNIPYQALIEQMTVGEIAQMTDEFSEEQLYDIARTYEGQHGNPVWNNNFGNSYEGYYAGEGIGFTRPYYNFNVPVMNFYFLSICKENRVKTTKANGRVYLDKASEKAKPVSPNKELISKDVQHRFEGMWIIGSDYIFNYGQSENEEHEMVAGSYSPLTKLPFEIIAPDIYDMQNKSLVERAIPHEDQLNLINLKIQQLLIMAKPPGHSIDQDALSGIMLGQGDSPAKPVEIYRMFAETGSILRRSRDVDGQLINGDAVKELDNGIGRDFPVLIEAYRAEMAKIEDVLGTQNEPQANAPVGTSEIASQVANNSLKTLYLAWVNVAERTAKGVATMIQDSINYNEEAFTRAVGANAVNAIKYGKKIALNEFAIKIEMQPEDKELAQLAEQIARGQEANPPLLLPSDVISIWQEAKFDIKKAAQMLVILEEKNQDAYSLEASKRTKDNGAVQQQSAQMAAQAQVQVDAELTKNKIMVLQTEAQIKDAMAEKEFQRAMKLQELKNQGTATVAEIGAGGKVNVQHAANEGKIVTQQVANAGKIDEKHIEHESKTSHIALEHALTPEKEKVAQEK